MDGLPSGIVVAFAGDFPKIPQGWHECDGSELDRNSYAQLFDAIGTRYGGDGNPIFRLPDYRGYFLRALTSDDMRDPDAPNRGVGSYQEDGMQNHGHVITGLRLEAQGGGGFEGGGLASNSSQGDHWPQPFQSFGVINARATSETRPKNVAVIYIIKC